MYERCLDAYQSLTIHTSFPSRLEPSTLGRFDPAFGVTSPPRPLPRSCVVLGDEETEDGVIDFDDDDEWMCGVLKRSNGWTGAFGVSPSPD